MDALHYDMVSCTTTSLETSRNNRLKFNNPSPSSSHPFFSLSLIISAFLLFLLPSSPLALCKTCITSEATAPKVPVG